MDLLLAGYASSSSSSSSSAVGGVVAGKHNDVGLLSSGRLDALPLNPPGDVGGAGDSGHGKAGAACNAGRGGDAGGVGERGAEKDGLEDNASGVEMEGEPSHVAKKRRTHQSIEAETQRAAPVIMAGYNEGLGDEQAFERSHPHWEGRWAGHVHLPLPPLELLDLVEGGDAQALGRAPESDDGDGSSRCGDSNSESGSCSSGGESSSDEEEDMHQQSRQFLPAARKLIHHWASVLGGENVTEKKERGIGSGQAKRFWREEVVDSAITIVPHIPMQSREKRKSFNRGSSPDTPLHISLARPIYLPGPSVDPFLSDLKRSLTAVLSVVNGANETNRQKGRSLVLQPRNATVFTNDQRSRSFLVVPVSANSARWVKRTLLPSIDAVMLRFGLETYYSTTEEGCILHVSVASAKGNVIPRMLRLRDGGVGGEGQSRSIPLFAHEGREDERGVLEPLPESIAVEVDRIECAFGSARGLVIPLR